MHLITTLRPSCALACALLLCAPSTIPGCAAGAQSPPSRALAARPEAEAADPFSSIGSVRELRDGRVLVVDGTEKALRLVDFRSGDVSQVGREGQGPNEYGRPGRLIAMPGDTTLLIDIAIQRLLVIGPDGKPAGIWKHAPTSDGVSSNGFRVADARGRVYLIGRSVDITPQGPKPSDSAAVLRYDPSSSVGDTVAFVRLQETRMNVAQQAGKIQSVNIVRNPLAAADEWVVFPDGRVAVVRVHDYRVDMVSPAGARSSGAAIAYEKVRVTEADKAAARTRTGFGAPPSGVGAAVAGTPPDPFPWPEFKPPFLAGAAIAGANGELWVLRAAPAAATTRTYDIIDAGGRRVATIDTPSSVRILAVTARGVYAARSDADDLLYLQRYPLPATRPR